MNTNPKISNDAFNLIFKTLKIIFTVNAHPHEDVAFTFKAFSYASSTSRFQ